MTRKPIQRLALLISGNGSNLQAVLDAADEGFLPIQVCVVVSNRPGAYGLERARLAAVPTAVLEKSPGQKRVEYDRELATLVEAYHPDWIILAGWMRLLSSTFLNRFPGRVVNLHPALPGTFPGTDAIQKAFIAFHNREITHTGVMVHLVPDEGIDNGPVLAQEIVPIYPADSLEQLEKRIHLVEHRLLVETIHNLVS